MTMHSNYYSMADNRFGRDSGIFGPVHTTSSLERLAGERQCVFDEIQGHLAIRDDGWRLPELSKFTAVRLADLAGSVLTRLPSSQVAIERLMEFDLESVPPVHWPDAYLQTRDNFALELARVRRIRSDVAWELMSWVMRNAATHLQRRVRPFGGNVLRWLFFAP